MKNRYLRILSFSLAALLLPLGPLCGQNTRSQENRKAKLEKEISALNDLLSAARSKKSAATATVTLLQKKISVRKELIAQSDGEIAGIDANIAVHAAALDSLQRRLDTLSAGSSVLVKAAYKSRDSKLWYLYLLSSESLPQAYRRLSYMKGFSRSLASQARETASVKEQMAERKDSLEVLRTKAAALREDRVREVGALQGEEAEAKALVASIEKDRSRYQKELDAKRKQVEALNREIAAIINRAVSSGSQGSGKGKGSKEGKAVTSSFDTKLDGKFSSNKGKLPWPVSGTVVESFGQHYHPVYKNVKLPFNNGVTIAVAERAPVKAVFEGEVSQIVMMPGYNQCVLVRHGSYFTFYCKLGSVTVASGDKVKAGQLIGYVDSSGEESQLHFQLWSGRTPQNPELWLK